VKQRIISYTAPQVIFITEYMSSGSLKQFLKKTKKNHKTMNEKVTCVFLCVSFHLEPSASKRPFSKGSFRIERLEAIIEWRV